MQSDDVHSAADSTGTLNMYMSTALNNEYCAMWQSHCQSEILQVTTHRAGTSPADFVQELSNNCCMNLKRANLATRQLDD